MTQKRHQEKKKEIKELQNRQKVMNTMEVGCFSYQ